MSVAREAVKRRRRGRSRLGFVLVALMLVVAACGDDDAGTTTTAPGATTTTAAGATTTTGAPMAEGITYKIGFVVSETGPGSGLGIPEAITARMLAEQWAGGIMGPDGAHHAVEVIIYDDESNPDVAGTLVSRLINEDQVDVLVAGTLSGNALTMAPLAEEAEVAMISMASARSIVEAADGSARFWVFKTPQNNEHSAQWQRDYMLAQGYASVCYLFENGAYGQDTLNSAKAFFPAAGIEIVFEGSFDRTDTDFPIMAEAQASGCEAVVVGSIPPGSSSVTQAVFDFMPGVEVIGGHGSCNAQYIALAPEAVEGTVLPCGKLLFADTLPDGDPQKALLLQYIADYEAFSGGEAVSTFGGHAWDALQWAFEALGSLEEGPDLATRRAAIRDYIETEITDWPGTGGVFNVTPGDHLGLEYTGLGFVKVEGGWYANFPPSDW
jgi:branched-chain amino acid transport system substrate-binding protein